MAPADLRARASGEPFSIECTRATLNTNSKPASKSVTRHNVYDDVQRTDGNSGGGHQNGNDVVGDASEGLHGKDLDGDNDSEGEHDQRHERIANEQPRHDERRRYEGSMSHSLSELTKDGHTGDRGEDG